MKTAFTLFASLFLCVLSTQVFAQEQEEFLASQICECIEQSDLKDHLGKFYNGETRHGNASAACFQKFFSMEYFLSIQKSNPELTDPEKAEAASIRSSTQVLRLLSTQCGTYRDKNMLSQIDDLTVERANFIIQESKKKHYTDFAKKISPCFNETSVVKLNDLAENACMQKFPTLLKPAVFAPLDPNEQLVALGLNLSRTNEHFKQAYGREIEIQAAEAIKKIEEKKQEEKKNPPAKPKRFESNDYATSCECLAAIDLDREIKKIDLNVEDCLITSFVRHFRAGNTPDERDMNGKYLLAKMTTIDFVSDKSNHTSTVVKQFYDCEGFQNILKAINK